MTPETPQDRWSDFTEEEITVLQASLGFVTSGIIDEAGEDRIPEDGRADAGLTFAIAVPMMVEISRRRGEPTPQDQNVETVAAAIASGTLPELMGVTLELDEPEAV